MKTLDSILSVVLLGFEMAAGVLLFPLTLMIALAMVLLNPHSTKEVRPANGIAHRNGKNDGHEWQPA